MEVRSNFPKQDIALSKFGFIPDNVGGNAMGAKAYRVLWHMLKSDI